MGFRHFFTHLNPVNLQIDKVIKKEILDIYWSKTVVRVLGMNNGYKKIIKFVISSTFSVIFRLWTPISTKQTQLCTRSNLKIVRQQRTTGDYYASRR